MGGEFALHLALTGAPMDGGADVALGDVMAWCRPKC